MPQPTARRLPPQFGLRTMLAFMAGASLLFAIGNWFGPGLALGLAFFILLAMVHVIANSWGGRHFDPEGRRTQPGSQDAAEGEAVPAGPSTETVAQMQAEAHEGIRRIRLGWGTVLVTILGAVAGGFIGRAIGWATFDMQKPNATNGLIVAAVSAGILGGFLGFWCSSFVQIFFAMNAASWEGSRRRHVATRGAGTTREGQAGETSADNVRPPSTPDQNTS